jgi:hypothetical protein
LPQKECVGVSNLFPSSFFFGDSLVKAINLTATVIFYRRKEKGKKKTAIAVLLLSDSHCMKFRAIIEDGTKFTSKLLDAISLLFYTQFFSGCLQMNL